MPRTIENFVQKGIFNYFLLVWPIKRLSLKRKLKKKTNHVIETNDQWEQQYLSFLLQSKYNSSFSHHSCCVLQFYTCLAGYECQIFEKLFMANFFTFRICAENPLRRVRRNTFLYFILDDWPGIRTHSRFRNVYPRWNRFLNENDHQLPAASNGKVIGALYV